MNEAQKEDESNIVQETSEIISKLKDEGIEFDNTPTSTEDIELPFGGFVRNLGQIDDDAIRYYYTTSSVSVGFADSKIDFSCVGSDEDVVQFSITFPGSSVVSFNL